MKIRITYYGNEGTIYSVIEDYEGEIEWGTWDSPFPNEKGGPTMAFGLEECLMQSESCPMKLFEEGLKSIEITYPFSWKKVRVY